MTDISKPVTRKDHDSKMSGREIYTGDYETALDGGELLEAALARTAFAHAEILKITVPELPEGYTWVSAADVKRNVSYYPLNDTELVLTKEQAEKIKNSMPLFADRFSEYAGQPVGLIAGKDRRTAKQLAAKVTIEYRELPAVTRLENSTEAITEYNRTLGDPDAAFLEADFVYEGSFSTGRQYQAYLETHGIIAEPVRDGGLYIHGSMQCPFTVREGVCYTLGLDTDRVRVRQDATGGAFGGKEDFPSQIAPQAAAAALKTGKAVRLMLDRREDIQYAYKRHPSLTRIRAAVKDGLVTAMDIDGMLDAGAYLVASGDVTMRYITTFPGVYSIPNLKVRARAMKTNTPPTGAFRGFGGPQAEFAVEMLMSHLADELGENELAFKARHMARKGTCTPTGGEYPFDIPLPEMIRMAEEATSYSELREKYAHIPYGRLKNGIGIAFANHGSPLCGNTEWGLIRPTVRMKKHRDGTVDLYTGQAELGQGVRTAFAKIAAAVLEIPFEKINTYYPDSDETAPTGPTAASRSVTAVGKTVEGAARRLKAEWKEDEEQEVSFTYTRPPSSADFDPIAMTGRQYDDYSWSVVVVKVQADILTGNVRILSAHGIYNLGTLIDENILRGQMEGGLLQALGYCASERMVIGDNGKMFNTAFADYHIPSATDVPVLSVDFEKTPYPDGPLGAKGAGEIPLVGVAAAFVRAVEQALGQVKPVKLNSIPLVPEAVLEALTGR